MKKVIIFRNDVLLRSETFIKDQTRFLVHWCPVLVGYNSVKDGLDLGDLETRIIPSAAAKTLGRYAMRLRQLLGRPHQPTVLALGATGAGLVHAHFGTDATDIWPSVKAVGLPMVVTLHGYDINIHRQWWEAGNGGIHRMVYPRRLLQMAHEPTVHFIAVSHAIKLRAIEYGIPEEKITVCYIGVDTERFKPGDVPIDQRKKRILFVGRMVENKGPLLLVRAFAEIRKQVRDAELVMIGDGPLLAKAKNLARKMSVEVSFLGAQSPEAVLTQLNKSRVLCLPSIAIANGASEAFGIVLIEAQSCGVPVVTSAQGGAKEGILERVTGHAFGEGDIPAMIQGLLAYLNNGNNLVRASAAARRYVQARFDLCACSAKLENIYDLSATISRLK